MAMYAIGILPLVDQLNSLPATQVWYADDAAAGGKIEHLHEWWVSLKNKGPSYGYHANPAKTWLIVKKEYLPSATELFAHTGVNITVDGKRHLGAALGSRSFVESYVQCKVSQWTDTVRQLSDIARTQPHAAYSAFTCGLASQWSYLSRTIPGISDMLIPIDNAINSHFIPSLTGRDSISDLERKLLVLPPHLGGLGITIPSEESIFEHSSSVKVCAPLVALIVQQNPTFSASTIFDQQQEKQRVRQLRRLKQKDTAQQLEQELPRHLRRAKELGSEKGASSWLTALPIDELGFALHKGDFRDALCLRYGWKPTNIPSKCACGTSFSVDHALCCKKGGFPTHRHNEIRDFTASVLTEVCHDVCTEPPPGTRWRTTALCHL